MKDLRWVLPFAFIVTVGSFIANVPDPDRGGELERADVGYVAIAVLAALATGLARRAPEAALLVPGVLLGSYFLLNGQPGPIFLAVPVGTLAVALLWPTLRWLPWAVAGTSLAALGLVLTDLLGVRDGGVGPAVGMVGITAAAGAVATAVKARRDARAMAAERAATQEQLRMAQDLHDGVGHGLAVIAMQAGVALHVIDKDPGAARRSLEAIRETSRESLGALRAGLTRLRPGEATAGAPRRGLAELDTLLDRIRAGGLEVTSTRSRGRDIPPEVDETAYVIVQEALTNVLRHANATSARVGLVMDGDDVLIRVTDDGQGGEPGPPDGTEGMGISGMRARVERLGGTLTAGRVEGGFEVAARMPLRAQ